MVGRESVRAEDLILGMGRDGDRAELSQRRCAGKIDAEVASRAAHFFVQIVDGRKFGDCKRPAQHAAKDLLLAPLVELEAVEYDEHAPSFAVFVGEAIARRKLGKGLFPHGRVGAALARGLPRRLQRLPELLQLFGAQGEVGRRRSQFPIEFQIRAAFDDLLNAAQDALGGRAAHPLGLCQREIDVVHNAVRVVKLGMVAVENGLFDLRNGLAPVVCFHKSFVYFAKFVALRKSHPPYAHL